MGFGVWGLGLGAWGLGLGAWGLGFVVSLGFRAVGDRIEFRGVWVVASLPRDTPQLKQKTECPQRP